MDPAIHVHTASDKSTTNYVKFMWETMLKLACHPEHLKLHVHCIGPAAVDLLNNLPQSTTQRATRATEGGSYGHAMCIMDALAMTGDGNIHIICDSDAFVVVKGWDNLVRHRVANGVGMLGTTYEDLGGFSSGHSNIQTYKRIPTFTWSIIAPGFDWNTLDVTPNKNHKVHIADETLSRIYNLPVGHYVFGEAGWQVPKFLHDHKIPYEGWRQLKPTKDGVVLKGLSDYHEEYHVDGIPFVVHHRGSLRHAFRESKLSREFFSKVDAWIENELQSEPKWSSPKSIGSWSQLSLPFDGAVPPIRINQTLQPLPEPSGWLKISINDKAVRSRGPIASSLHALKYDIDHKVNHIRVEGEVNCDLTLEIPQSPVHSFTIRNMTNAKLIVQKSIMQSSVNVKPGSTAFLIVDVDGVITPST